MDHQTSQGTGRPYTDIGEVRVIGKDVSPMELVWHRDRETRQVEVLEGKGWKFQFDNALPSILEVGTILHIPRGTYHRVIKGKTDLKVRIKKFDN